MEWNCCFNRWLIFFRFYKVFTILLLHIMLLLIDCNYDKKNPLKKLRKVNNCTFISLLKGEIFRYFIKSSKKFPLEMWVWEASWEGISLNFKGKGSQMATLKIKYPYPPSEGWKKYSSWHLSYFQEIKSIV